MKANDRALNSAGMSNLFEILPDGPWFRTAIFTILVVLSLGVPPVLAQSKIIDADPDDWCFGQDSVSRVEDSSATLTCGTCDGLVGEACVVSDDCPGGEACVDPGAYSEIVWWDARTDGAVNDLGTVAVAQDNSSLYIIAELWVDPDPSSLPFGELFIDFQPGGSNELWDPGGGFPPVPPDQIKAPGHCSESEDRACTRNEDCWFCNDSFEPPACCEIGTCPPTELCRVRACGSGCDDGDTCDQSQTCVELGTTPVNDLGVFSSPSVQADYALLFDFSVWLIDANLLAVRLKKWDGDSWENIPSVCANHTDLNPLPCNDDGDCDPPNECVTGFVPKVDPGASGGAGGPPGAVELEVPWEAFGCTGCPDNCECPDFGPGQDFVYTLTISRGEFFGDFVPRGEMEDVMSEAVAGTTTTTTNSCPGTGIGTTQCELGDASTDGFVPQVTQAPGGAIADLRVGKNVDPGLLELSWNASCSNGDTDYEVYRGDLDGLPAYSHGQLPGSCTTGGALSATIDADCTGNWYYLVVPTDGSTEGSYGVDSDGVERPAADVPCRPQSLGTCP